MKLKGNSTCRLKNIWQIVFFQGFSNGSSYLWVLFQKSPVSLFSPAIIRLYLNFLFQLQLEKELLVDQELQILQILQIFQSKQILSWLQQRIWLVNLSGAIFLLGRKFQFFQIGARFFLAKIRELTFILSLMHIQLTQLGDNLSSKP